MPKRTPKKAAAKKPRRRRAGSSWDAFISYSWNDKVQATRVEHFLSGDGLRVWIDHSVMRGGDPLRSTIDKGLNGSANVVLLWSKSAAASRPVGHEWQTALYRGKCIIPCLLDATDLPQALKDYWYVDFGPSPETGISRLLKALGGKPIVAPRPSLWKPEKTAAVVWIERGQEQVLAYLSLHKLSEAAKRQAKLEPMIKVLLKSNPDDPLALQLMGYHRKNDYLIRYWDKIQARQFPEDPVLREAEDLFLTALSIQPGDIGALNGLGNTMMLQEYLDAAESRILQALQIAEDANLHYEAAESDLKTVRMLKRERGMY